MRHPLRTLIVLGLLVTGVVMVAEVHATLTDPRVDRFCAGHYPHTWAAQGGPPDWATPENTERLCLWVPRLRAWFRIPRPCNDAIPGCPRFARIWTTAGDYVCRKCSRREAAKAARG